MPGLGAGLSGLSATEGGYLEAEKSQADIAQRKQQTRLGSLEEAQGVLKLRGSEIGGRGLSLLYGGGQPQGPPPPSPPPGQPSQPAQPTPGMAGQPAPLTGQPQERLPPSMVFGPQGLPGQGMQGGGTPPQPGSPVMQPPPGPQGQPSMRPPQAGGPPMPGGGSQRMGGAPGGGGQGPISLQSVIDAVVRANPGAKPAEIAAGVDHLLPLLKIEEQMAWRQAQLQQKDRALDQKESQFTRQLSERGRIADEKNMRLITQAQDKLDFAYSKLDLARTEEERKQAQQELNEAWRDKQLADKTRHDDVMKDIAGQRADVQRERTASGERQTAARIEGAGERLDKTLGARREEGAATRRSREDIAAARQQSQETIAAGRVEGAKDVAGIQAGARVDVAEIQARSREAAAQLSADTKLKLFDMNTAVRRELQDKAIQGKFDLTGMSQAGKQALAQFNAGERQKLAEYLEAGREERHAQDLTEKRLKREAQEAIQIQKIDAAKEISKRRFEQSDERLALSKMRVFGPNEDQQKQILESAGVTPERIKAGADFIRATGKEPTDVAGMPPAAKAAYRTAINNLANKQWTDEGQNPGTAKARAQAEFRAAGNTINRFLGAGPQGDSTRFLSVAQSHMDTLRTLARQWAEAPMGPGQIQVFNKVKAYLSTQLGYAFVPNMEAAAKILGTEIIKSLAVARAGTAQEREEIAALLSAKLSPDQLLGVREGGQPGILDTFERLLGGQLNGLRDQFVRGAGSLYPPGKAAELFNGMLSEQAKSRMEENKKDPRWQSNWKGFDPDNFRSGDNKDPPKPKPKTAPRAFQPNIGLTPRYGGPGE